MGMSVCVCVPDLVWTFREGNSLLGLPRIEPRFLGFRVSRSLSVPFGYSGSPPNNRNYITFNFQ